MSIIDTKKAKSIMEIAEENHWHFRHIAKGGMIYEPVIYNKVKYIPADQDDSYIPPWAWKRLEVVKANAEFIGAIVAHELKDEEEDQPRPKIEFKPPEWVKGLGRFAIAAATMTAKVIGFSTLLILGLLVDPALIAVVRLEDGEEYWIEVASWLD